MTAQIRMIATAAQKITPIESPVIGIKRTASIALIAAALYAAIHITPAPAQTITGTGFTQIHGSTSMALNVGSPSAGTLIVEAVGCYDNGAGTAPAIGTPSGWTRETGVSTGDTFGEAALFWKVASGSEGATVAFAITSMNNIDCGAHYWKATGVDGTDPVDAANVAWASALTQDPPSITFASGPRDGVVLAFCQDRGDNPWSSGPGGLSTTAQSSAPGLSLGRTVAIGYQAFTATSSKDPTTCTNTGSARPSNALTAVIYAAATGGQAQLLSGPTKRLLRGKL